MPGKLTDQKRQIPCGNPDCTGVITITLGQAVSGGEVKCKTCGATSVLRPTDTKAAASINRLQRSLDRLGAQARSTSDDDEVVASESEPVEDPKPDSKPPKSS